MGALETAVRLSIGEAEAIVRSALGEEGFGVLTEIDVTATLRAKLGLERTPLKILGACNPRFAHQALELDPSVALMMPCNVVLDEAAPGATRVQIADPRGMMPGPDFAPVASEAAEALGRVVGRLEPFALRVTGDVPGPAQG